MIPAPATSLVDAPLAAVPLVPSGPVAVSPALAELQRAFGTPFALVDGETGEVLRPSDLPGGDWQVWGAICREVASRGKIELIDELGPLLMLAIPVSPVAGRSTLAVAGFLTHKLSTPRDFGSLAGQLGTSVASVAQWSRRQVPWTTPALLRMAEVVRESLAVAERNATLKAQIDKLSGNLATTYEEITLLFRLTENLRLSDGVNELGRRALAWLFEVVPAKGLAAEFSAATRMAQLPDEGTAEPDFVTHGNVPMSRKELDALALRLKVSESRQPVVVNRVTQEDGSSLPEVHHLILVPVWSGGKSFGYLAAINHNADGEFGTVEARLLGSVATILAIHCGNLVLYREQAELFSGVVRALSSAIDAKDPYTCGHSDRVARVAVQIADEMGLAIEIKRTLYLAGLLHDIGKIGINDEVLRKPGKLTPAEYEHIKQHPVLGYSILRGLKKIEPVLPAVLHHHESWDGRGYPHGLKGEEIPLIARIIAVADAFDAMGSDRPYRQGMDDTQLDEILRSGAGRQWDAEVVGAFFRAREEVREISRHEREHLEIDAQAWA